jgi:hypothetical protein
MMSLHARRELVLAVFERYRKSNKSDKSRILNEFVEASGYNRKYALELLSARNNPRLRRVEKAAAALVRQRRYGPELAQPLNQLWKASGGICPKRLMPFLFEFIPAMERGGEVDLCPQVRQKLLSMSIATAERILSQLHRSHEHGLSTTTAGTLLRHQIPIRTYEEWTEGKPGFFEIDLVAHCGNTVLGEFVHTLTMTDAYTGWTECVAIWNRSRLSVIAAIEIVRKRLPFPLLGIDSDNGSEFINHSLKAYCDEHGVTFTRSRPYKKNDQCHVEQKNGAVVRPLIGYARYEGEQAAKHLNQMYAVDRLCVNFFEPSMKLIDKVRTGAKVKKVYDTPKTPWQRLTDSGTLSPDFQQKIQQHYLTLNPAKLRRRLNDLELDLRKHAANNPSICAEGGQSNEQK